MAVGRILVASDFSPGADAALRYALELGPLLGASDLHLLHVAATSEYADFGGEVEDSVRRGLEAELAALASRHAAASLSLRTHLSAGAPATEIVRIAQELRADLVVMGTAGRTGLGHALMGSVAERVVRTCPCPVLTVRTPR